MTMTDGWWINDTFVVLFVLMCFSSFSDIFFLFSGKLTSWLYIISNVQLYNRD